MSIAAVSMFLLAGCSTAVAGPLPGESTPSLESSATSTEPLSEDSDVPSVDDEAPTAQPGDRVGGWPLDPPVDTGATEGARGQTIDDDGTLVGYIVARDDNIEAIARRFDLEYAYLVVINGARRNVGLYEDDVINLDAHYIMSLGTENGKALSLTPPDPLPPQQPAPDGY